jgi:hypothetical protein
MHFRWETEFNEGLAIRDAVDISGHVVDTTSGFYTLFNLS